MLEKLTHDDLLQLTSVIDGPCVSIYVPNAPEKTMRLEYESLVRQASSLLTHDERTPHKDSILQNLYNFNPSEFLKSMDPGLVLFVNKHWQNFYVPSHAIPSKVVVADSFHLRPLLEDLQKENVYNILALSLEEAIFLRCDGSACNESHRFLLHLGTHSNSIHWTHPEGSETFQIPHLKAQLRGRGSLDNQNKKRSIKLFHKWIEAKINKVAGYKTLPLFVFSSDVLFRVYKESSTHEEAVLCSIDIKKGIPSLDSLIHQSRTLVQKKHANQKHNRTVELSSELSELQRKKMLIDDLVKISRAALNGQVQTLYLQNDREVWGELHRKSAEITFHEKQLNSHDDDILDDIACEVLKHGGEVVVLARKDMPTPSPAAAILNS